MFHRRALMKLVFVSAQQNLAFLFPPVRVPDDHASHKALNFPFCVTNIGCCQPRPSKLKSLALDNNRYRMKPHVKFALPSTSLWKETKGHVKVYDHCQEIL